MPNPQQTQQQPVRKRPVESESFFDIDYMKLLQDALSYWWLFVLCVAVALAVVFVYHRYKIPVYSSQLTLLLDDRGSGAAGDVASNAMLQGLSVDFQDLRTKENNIAILRSRTLNERVLDQMGIDICYYKKGTIRTTEQYPCGEFHVVMDSTHVQTVGARFNILLRDSLTFELVIDADKAGLFDYSRGTFASGGQVSVSYRQVHSFGEPIVTDKFAFAVIKHPVMDQMTDDEGIFEHYQVEFKPPYTQGFGLNVLKDKESTVLTLAAQGTNQGKVNQYLHTLATTFINDNLSQKNQMAENSIKFIESQLTTLSDTLLDIGTQLSMFRTNHGLQLGVTSKGNKLFREIEDYETEIQKQGVLVSYYDYISEYLRTDSVVTGSVFAPPIYNTGSSLFEQQLNNLLKLNADYQALQSTYGTSYNPATREVLTRFNIARNTLLSTIANNKNLVIQNVNELKRKMQTNVSEAMSLPETERKLLGIDRQFSLTNEVYTFLLRKRSEAQLQKASSTSDHKILDDAATVGIVSPRYAINQLLALIIGLGLPLAFLIIRQWMDNKLRTAEDLKKMTPLPIVGEIPSCHYQDSFVVESHPGSIVSEAYRHLRAKLHLVTLGKESLILGVSSSMPGDGKSFTARNVASVYAISGKKTVLLGFDLRRPALSKVLNQNKHVGITHYIMEQATLEEVIINQSNNLDVIVAGEVPPNAAELILHEKTAELIDKLKERYDVIVVDTPPMAAVADAYQIAEWCDAMLFVVRQDYTRKDVLKDVSASLVEQSVKNPVIVLNDVGSKNCRYGYRYGYGKYGYGRYSRYGKKYGYGYRSQNYGYTKED
ncbi:MAG: polysaccharide biosynthesis tyrosine autokinase [Bacteroidales bacterium]|nr:polysaccharide biosynthesis tyrosine autokinase [Bacteroidales bacterium]